MEGYLPDSLPAHVSRSRSSSLDEAAQYEQLNSSSEHRPLLAGGSTQQPDGFSAYVDQPIQIHNDRLEIKTYKRRWYMLFIFTTLGFTQGCIWNTWGPLASSAKLAFGWTDADVALQTNWGPITYLVSALFLSWLMDVKGLRWACLLSAGLVFLGGLVRCITSQPPAVTWLMHLGQFFNGFGGVVAMGGPPLMSATWFPVQERTTATGIACTVNGLGVAVAFIIGPLLVPQRNVTDGNMSMANLASNTSASNTTLFIQSIRADIMKLMYIEFAWCALMLLGFLLYFPSHPPLPPSITASISRMNFKQGIKTLIRNKSFWLLAGAYALSSGVYNCWSSVLDVILSPLGVSQTTAGWIGFAGTVAGNLAAVLLSRFADIFTRKLKTWLLVLYSLGALQFIIFALECAQILPLNVGVLYATMILGSICVDGAVPLLYELICEACYPVAEGLTNGFTTWLNNAAGLVFLLLPMLKVDLTSMLNMAMFWCTIVCIPMFNAYEEHYIRLDIDTGAVRATDIQSAGTSNQQQQQQQQQQQGSPRQRSPPPSSSCQYINTSPQNEE